MAFRFVTAYYVYRIYIYEIPDAANNLSVAKSNFHNQHIQEQDRMVLVGGLVIVPTSYLVQTWELKLPAFNPTFPTL